MNRKIRIADLKRFDVAEYVDWAKIAGQVCEQAYDVLKVRQ